MFQKVDILGKNEAFIDFQKLRMAFEEFKSNRISNHRLANLIEKANLEVAVQGILASLCRESNHISSTFRGGTSLVCSSLSPALSVEHDPIGIVLEPDTSARQTCKILNLQAHAYFELYRS